MIEWNETHLAFRDMVKRFVDAEVKPHLEAMEHGESLPTTCFAK